MPSFDTLAASLTASLTSGLHTVVGFLFVLSIVVIVHELGHFLVARYFGVKVDSFAMGFMREVWGFTDRYGTRWRLNWLPLGGYVQFMGDANGASVPDTEAIARMTSEQRKGSYYAKPVGQRAAIIFAGPFANFLLAIVLFGAMSMIWGVTTVPPVVQVLVPGGAAQKAGLQVGDRILSVDGHAITSFGELGQYLAPAVSAHPLDLKVSRGAENLSVSLNPELKQEDDGFGGTFKYGDLGLTFPPRVKEVTSGSPAETAGLKAGDLIVSVNGNAILDFAALQKVVSESAGIPLQVQFDRAGKLVTTTATPASVTDPDAHGGPKTVGRLGLVSSVGGTTRHYGPIRALVRGAEDSVSFISANLSGIGQMLTHPEMAKQIGGPLRIAAVAGQAASLGPRYLLDLAAKISLSVGLFNLFPIPLLDGGHLMFFAAEAIRGKPLSDRVKEYGFTLGAALIGMLFLLVMWNDQLIPSHWLGG